MEEKQCRSLTKTGKPCRMRPLASGVCWTHTRDPEVIEARQNARRKGGSLMQARKALAKAKHDTIAKFGITEPLPSLDSVESARVFLVGVAGKVLKREISPAAGNCLASILRASKELLALETDIKLAEQLDALDAKDRRP